MISNISNNSSINNTQNTQSTNNNQQTNNNTNTSQQTGTLSGGGTSFSVRKSADPTSTPSAQASSSTGITLTKNDSPVNQTPNQPNPTNGDGKANTYNTDDCKPQMMMKYQYPPKTGEACNPAMDGMKGMDSTDKTGKTNKKDEQIKNLTENLGKALDALGSLADSNKELVGLLKEALGKLDKANTPPADGTDPSKGTDPAKGTDSTKDKLAGLLNQLAELLKQLLKALEGNTKQPGVGQAGGGQASKSSDAGQAGGAGKSSDAGQANQVDGASPATGAEQTGAISEIVEQLKNLLSELEKLIKGSQNQTPPPQQQAQDTLMAKMSTMRV